MGAENALSPSPLTPPLNITLPDTFDKWRQEGYLSPPADQARCGARYAFAAVGRLADRVSIATHRRARHPLPTQFVLSCLLSKYETGAAGPSTCPRSTRR